MSLQSGRLGWPMIAGLSVAIVVAGQFSGWNYGLAGGWANMLVATLVVALFYVGLALCVAELSSALPSAGGFGTYSQLAFGPLPGFLVGLAVFVALAIGTGAAANFISSYAASLFGVSGWPLKLALFVIIIGIHLRGVGEAMGLTFAAGAVAVVSLFVFCGALAPKFDVSNLIAADQTLSVTPGGIVACVPFAVWLFLGLEQAATASEEVRDPGHAMPRGLLTAIAILLCTALGVLIIAPGAGGSARIAAAGDPLYAAMTSPTAFGRATWLGGAIGLAALFGLAATFFSLSYSASRQLFSLARDIDLPGVSATNKHGTPTAALLVVGAIGFLTSAVSPEKILVSVVFLLSLSYVFTLAAFIWLRRFRSDLARPFRTPGGTFTAVAALALSMLVVSACFQLDRLILTALLATLVGGALLFGLRRLQLAPRA